MGQTASKPHDPLTFGYINQTDNGDLRAETIPERDQQATDYILAHPHLYKLEFTCQNGCSNSRRKCSISNGDCNEPQSVVVATKVKEECEICRHNKRLSLVRRDLAKDLAYIDETYYPDVIHYMSNDEEGHNEDIDSDSILASPDGGDENIHKLTIGEVAPGKSKAARLADATIAVNLSNRSLIKLSPSIGYLDNLTKLDLSHNQMTGLPRTIGYLKNLRILDTSHNRLESVPDTIGFLTKLTALNLSHNNLQALPASIGLLTRLVVVIANDNRLASLPREVAQLRELVSLNVSNNPLKSLPAGIASLSSLRKLVADGCEFWEEFSYSVEQRSGPPSLFELCARAAVRHEIFIPGYMAEHIKEFFGRVQKCSFCGGPFFDSFVTRGRFIERSARQIIALEDRLCSAHWFSDKDRVQALFAPLPPTAIIPSRTRKPNINIDGLIENPQATQPSQQQQQQQNNAYVLSPQPRRILSNNNRCRAYSDLSIRSFTASPAQSLSSSTSSQVSRKTNSSVSLSRCSSPSYSPQSEPDLVSIQSLKRQPSLPALPVPGGLSSSTSSNSLSPSSTLQPRRRPRASSSSSVTRRLTGFLSSTPSLSFSSSNLRVQQPSIYTTAATTTDAVASASTPIEGAAPDSVRSNCNRLEGLHEVDFERTATSPLDGSDEISTTRVIWQAQPSIIFTSDEDTGGAPSSSSPVPIAPHLMRTAIPKIPPASGFRASLAHIGARLITRDRSGTL